jgi:hypothetical protein
MNNCIVLEFLLQGSLEIKHAVKPVQAKIYFVGHCMVFIRRGLESEAIGKFPDPRE